MIGSVIKYFRFPFEYVLWELSYANLNMLLATIPAYDHDDPTEKAEKVDGLDGLADLLN